MEKQNIPPPEKEKKITVYNTRGECSVEFKTKARNWGELKKDLDKHDIKHTDMKAVIGETQQELENNEEEIKGQDLSLWLTPRKVRSGN